MEVFNALRSHLYLEIEEELNLLILLGIATEFRVLPRLEVASFPTAELMLACLS
jgi:hypothetical protein